MASTIVPIRLEDKPLAQLDEAVRLEQAQGDPKASRSSVIRRALDLFFLTRCSMRDTPEPVIEQDAA